MPSFTRTAALALASAVVLLGCGSGSSEPAPPARVARVTQVDAALRGVVGKAPADARAGVRFVSSQDVLRLPFDRAKTAMVVLGAKQFPAWDPKSERISGSRVIAQDRPILLGRKDGPDEVDRLPSRALIGHATTPAGTAELTAEIAGVFTDPIRRREDGRLARYRGRTFRTTAEALSALVRGDVGAVAVMRSSLGLDADPRLKRLRTDGLFPGVLLQMGTLRRTPSSSALRRWLTSGAGTAALREAGFGGPGEYAPRTGPSELTRAKRRVAVLRRPRAATDRFAGYTIPTYTSVRAIGPDQVARQHLYVAYDKRPDRVCVIAIRPASETPGAPISDACDRAARITSASARFLSGDLLVGLVPDGIGCVEVRRRGLGTALVPVQRNGYAVPVRTSKDRALVDGVRFVRGGC